MVDNDPYSAFGCSSCTAGADDPLSVGWLPLVLLDSFPVHLQTECTAVWDVDLDVS